MNVVYHVECGIFRQKDSCSDEKRLKANITVSCQLLLCQYVIFVWFYIFRPVLCELFHSVVYGRMDVVI